MARLGAVIEQIRGVSYKPSDLSDKLDDNSVVLLRANNIKNGDLVFDDVVYVSKNRVNERQYLKRGDILVCTSSGSKELVGKAAFVRADLPMVFGAFCKVIRPRIEYAEYIGHFFQSPYYRNHISAASAGANINNLRNEHIADLQISLPPLDEQRKVVAVLDKVSDLIAKRQAQLDKLDLLVKARFVEMFGDPVSNPKGWPKVALSDLADVRIGPFGSLLHKEDYIEGGCPLVNTSHIVDGQIVVDKKFTVPKDKYEEMEPYHLKIGDVVMGRRGEMGRCAVVCDSGLLCGTGSLIIRPKSDVTADYIQKIISFPSFKRTIEDMAVGQTMPNLNVPIVSSFQIIKPPVEIQKKYYELVERVEKIKSSIRGSLDRLETLKKALLQQYFG